MTQFLAMLGATGAVGGVWIAAAGVRRTRPRAGPSRRAGLASHARQFLGETPELRYERTRRLVAVLAGVVVWAVTGWLVLLVIVPAAVVGLPVLVQPSRGKQTIARLEALEEWTRALAGVLTVGVGLEQAIMTSLRSAPGPIEPQIATLVARLRSGWDTADALRAFADDLDDATGDLIASSLILAAWRRGNGLPDILEGLAVTVSEDVAERRGIEADRAKPRQNALIVTIIFLAVLPAVFVLNSDYVSPYGTPAGQAVLIVLLSGYAAALVWMRRMTTPRRLPRFLTAQQRA